jgi:formylglycine-generating enzyme required for sulfatase activity
MVRIPGKNYEIGKYEVTQAEWRAVMGNNPSENSSCGDKCPVDNVSWDDAQVFIQKLTARSGKQYRLPTEAEWEYTCYGGSQSRFCGGNDPKVVAWIKENSNNQSHPVGQRQANGFGVYDMSGNVEEWLNDCWERGCNQHMHRGGAWNDEAGLALPSGRSNSRSEYRGFNVGFRLAMTLP